MNEPYRAYDDKWFGYCAECGADLQLTKDGNVWVHGPRNKRCPGSQKPPVQLESAS